ncbi:MAG: hypothetical protein ACPGQL_00840 [Thermoplasmatota archaeon]
MGVRPADIERDAKALEKLWLSKDLQLVPDSNVTPLKNARASPELRRLKEYTVDGQELRWLRMGLVMRGKHADLEYINEIKRALRRTQGDPAVYVAQAVQCGALAEVVTWAEATYVAAQARIAVRKFIDQIETTTVFVDMDDDSDYVGNLVLSRLRVNSPDCFLLAASGRAVSIAKNAMGVVGAPFGYSMKIIDEGNVFTTLFTRKFIGMED